MNVFVLTAIKVVGMLRRLESTLHSAHSDVVEPDAKSLQVELLKCVKIAHNELYCAK